MSPTWSTRKVRQAKRSCEKKVKKEALNLSPPCEAKKALSFAPPKEERRALSFTPQQ